MAGSNGERLQQAGSGNQDALGGLLERHSPAVVRWVASRIPRRWRSVLSVGDVMQQTYTDAFLCFDSFRAAEGCSFGAGLMSLARNNLVDALRMLNADKRGKGRRPVEPQACEDSLPALYEFLGSTPITPSRLAARKEARAALERAIEGLPDTYRRVVQMCDLESHPVLEVADAVGRSPGAVYMIRARAHRRLRELMGSTSNYFSTA
jgi:RNA polymerase sigma-70 factor (ECF subfamily)